ncbi:MAG: LytTR family DNA-binding domain-containing protein [Bacteroidota bacterium]|nr:LytTR family DNA-binding domain-containing protein [Bacteroidota bacterium]
MIKAVIIDDESDAVDFIASIIEEYCKDVELLGSANSAREGAELIREKQPELVFLDVEMPHGTGFDLLENFPEKNFDVIFITAYNHYAIQAIKYSAVDYILKPINIEELVQAVEKLKENRFIPRDREMNYDALLQNLKTGAPSKLAIPTSEGVEFLNTRDIVRIEADRSYSWFYLKGGKKILVSRNLKEYQEMLDDRYFFRAHNSHLINLDYVKKYVRQYGGSIVMEDGSSVPISRTKKDVFMKKIAQFSK